jgi:hypothetical protein
VRLFHSLPHAGLSRRTTKKHQKAQLRTTNAPATGRVVATWVASFKHYPDPGESARPAAICRSGYQLQMFVDMSYHNLVFRNAAEQRKVKACDRYSDHRFVYLIGRLRLGTDMFRANAGFQSSRDPGGRNATIGAEWLSNRANRLCAHDEAAANIRNGFQHLWGKRFPVAGLQ